MPEVINDNDSQRRETMRRLTIRMTTEMHEELRKLSYQEYRPVNKIIIEALEQYLKTSKS